MRSYSSCFAHLLFVTVSLKILSIFNICLYMYIKSEGKYRILLLWFLLFLLFFALENSIYLSCIYIYIYACMYVFLSVYLYSKSSNRLRCFIYFTNWPDSTLSKHITGQLINIDSYRCMYVSICVCIYIYMYVIRLLLFHVFFVIVYVIDPHSSIINILISKRRRLFHLLSCSNLSFMATSLSLYLFSLIFPLKVCLCVCVCVCCT